MYLNIAIIHDQIFRHEILQCLSINNIKLRIALEAIDHRINALLKLIPVLFVFLDFALSTREVFVEFLQVVMVIDFFELVLLSYFAKLGENFFAKLACFFRKKLLHIEEVPIRAYAREHIIKEVIKLRPESISNPYDLVTKCYLVLGQILFNFILDHTFSILDVFQRFLNFFFQGCFEVKLVHRIERDNWVEKMVGVQALCADLLLAFQAEEDVVGGVERALILSGLYLHLRWRLFSLLSFLEFADRILNLNIF